MLSLFVCSSYAGREGFINRSLFDESEEKLYVSTFDLDSSNRYVGRGSLNKFCPEKPEFTSVTDIPFRTLDANGEHTKFIGTVNELQQQGLYGIVEYDLVTGQRTDILSYEELIEECGRAEETQDEIEQVRYRNSGNACSFIYGKKLWTVKDKRTELLADLTGMYWGHYEWLSDNEILVETDGKRIAYSDDYFTITHSGAQKTYVMNIENKVKKMITKEQVWGIAWGI